MGKQDTGLCATAFLSGDPVTGSTLGLGTASDEDMSEYAVPLLFLKEAVH